MFCQHCGGEIVEGQVFCQRCGARLVAEAAPASPDSGRSKTSWEDRATKGFLKGLFKTVWDVLSHSSVFFKTMPVTGGLTDPLLFAMIIGTVGLMCLSAWDLILHDSMRGFLTPQMMNASGGQGMSDSIASPLGTFMIPFVFILWLFIVSGILHFVLMLIGGAKAGFEATFRVISYSVSPFLFMVVPYCGVLLTPLWVLALVMIGLRDAHEISGGKAMVAVLFPFLLGCGALVLAAILFMGAIVSSFGALLHMYR